MTYAIDFDGTLCESAWPEIGSPKMEIIQKVIKLKEEGHELILWSCRTGQLLTNAINFCLEHGITFDAINENLQEHIDHFGEDCRKIHADYYLDDKAINVLDF